MSAPSLREARADRVSSHFQPHALPTMANDAIDGVADDGAKKVSDALAAFAGILPTAKVKQAKANVAVHLGGGGFQPISPMLVRCMSGHQSRSMMASRIIASSAIAF